MVAKAKSDLAPLLAVVPAPRGLGLKPWDRGKRIIVWLNQHGRRDSNEINVAFPGNRADLLDLLRVMVDAGFLGVDDKRYGGRADSGKAHRQPNLYWVEAPAIRAAATLASKLKTTDPLETAPKELRELFLRIDLAHPAIKKAGIRTEHRLWRVAQFCCAVHPRRVALLRTLATEMGLDSRDGVKPIQVSAIAAGWVNQPKPVLKGQIGRPANDYEVQLVTIQKHATLAEPRASLGPQRATDPLGELTPIVDRRTREQRRWVAALESRWEETKVGTVEDWQAFKNLLCVVGPGITSTYRKLAKELGAQSTTPVEKYVRRATKAGLFDRTNLKKGGVKITPTDRLDTLAGDVPKSESKRKAKAPAATNGEAAAVEIAPGRKSDRGIGRPVKWIVFRDWAQQQLRANPAIDSATLRETFRKIPQSSANLPPKGAMRALVSDLKKKLAATPAS